MGLTSTATLTRSTAWRGPTLALVGASACNAGSDHGKCFRMKRQGRRCRYGSAVGSDFQPRLWSSSQSVRRNPLPGTGADPCVRESGPERARKTLEWGAHPRQPSGYQRRVVVRPQRSEALLLQSAQGAPRTLNALLQRSLEAAASAQRRQVTRADVAVALDTVPWIARQRGVGPRQRGVGPRQMFPYETPRPTLPVLASRWQRFPPPSLVHKPVGSA